jgi:hypothetical protein
VPLLGGTRAGARTERQHRSRGVDWQINRADGVLDIAAHYVIVTPDGALVEVQSNGLRHGPAEVLARLAAGEAVGRTSTSSARWCASPPVRRPGRT